MKEIWLIGAGSMAYDYIKVLDVLPCSFTVVGRGEESALSCEKETGCSVVTGGVETFLAKKPALPTHAIVSVGIDKLYETTKALLAYGIKEILVEKPGGMFEKEFDDLVNTSRTQGAHVLIAYNRRFYASVLKARELIEKDGGVSSFNFEFTEWAHIIGPLEKAKEIKAKWFLGNSTHVVDLAFFLGGKPKDLCSFSKGGLEWHEASSVFSGAGISDCDALFSYQANWESAGRWSVEMLTREHKLILRPMEKLQIQKRGTVTQDFVEIDDTLDTEFKPGLMLQTKRFIEGDHRDFCTIEEQAKMMPVYNKMANYSDQ